ncbi:MAG: MFS transporter, partial [Nitratireductor sp.]
MLNFQITACLSDQTSSATRRALIRRWVQEKMVCPEAHSAVKATITAVSFAIFIGITYGFSMDLFSMLIPDIYNSIGLTYVEIGAIAGAARFGFFAASLFAGALASRIGPGRVILGSVILSILAQVGMSVAHASWLVLVLALILGVCSSAVYMPMVAVVGKVIAFRHRARAFGVISSGQSYAVFFCGFFVPPVLAAAGWREVWQLVSTIGLLVTALAATLLVYYKIVERKCRTQTSSSNQTPHPPFRAICTPPALMVWLLMLLSGLATYPFQTYLSPYVREELRMPVEVAGNMWAAIGFVGMWGGFLMGFVADWVGIRAALVLCYLAMLLAASMLYLQAAPFYLVGAAGLYGL